MFYNGRMLRQAIACAEFCHRDQLDKNGEPYINHPRRIADNADTHSKKILAYLHDCLEDQRNKLILYIALELNHPETSDLDYTDETALWLVSLFFGPEVSDALDAISHRKNEPKPLYYKRVRANALAHSVKLLDIADNTDPDRLARLDAETQIRLNTKYNAALASLTL